MRNAVKGLLLVMLFLFCLSTAAYSNPYLDKLKSLPSSNGMDSLWKMLANIDKSTLFQIKKSGIETKNPVDDFLNFAEECGLGQNMGGGDFRGVANPLYFALVLKIKKGLFFDNDKFDDIEKVATFNDNGGGVLRAYIDLDKNTRLYFVKTYHPGYFLNAIFNSSSWNISASGNVPVYNLDHNAGEKIYFIPHGMLPEVAGCVLVGNKVGSQMRSSCDYKDFSLVSFDGERPREEFLKKCAPELSGDPSESLTISARLWNDRDFDWISYAYGKKDGLFKISFYDE